MKYENQREAVEALIRNGIDIDDDAKVILHSPRQPGIKLLGAIDYLCNSCQFNKLGPIATESFLKARKISEDRKRKLAKAYGMGKVRLDASEL